MDIKKGWLFIVGAMLMCFVVSAVSAEETNFGDKVPAEGSVLNALDPDIAGRAIKPGRDKNEPLAISLEISFEKNSSELTMKSKKSLDAVAQDLSNERLSGYKFTIEGHTDASGPADYNKRLSQKRAESVRNYLSKKSDLKSERLETVGKGKEDLLLPDEPYSSKNRRVKIINSGK